MIRSRHYFVLDIYLIVERRATPANEGQPIVSAARPEQIPSR
jgi:hypothetical protein